MLFGKKIKLTISALALCLAAMPGTHAQMRMTMEDAIATARSQSVEALEARQAFISTYWAWRSFRASRLPSLTLYGTLMNYNRSLVLLQNYDNGQLKYASSNNLQNNLGLKISQNVTFTGGTVTAYTDLSRIDQFGLNKKLTWYSQPVTVRYVQPLFSYNQFKWDKLIEPKEYERGRRRYVESMEQVTINAVSAYFSLVQALKNQEVVKSNYENTGKMRSVAAERMRLGSVTRAEYLQLELRALNDSISIGESLVNVRQAQMYLNSILGYDESVEVEPVVDDALPDILMDYGLVMEKALKNSTFSLDNQINELNAASNVAKAKADRGISMSLNARFGLSQTGNGLPDVYKDLLNQEVVGLTFSVPIFDWGLGKGKVQKAKAAEEVVKAQHLQSENDYRRKIFTAVGQFNNQRQQCMASRKAMEIASERYELMMDKFRRGSATVTDLTNAQNDNESAMAKYITDYSNFWTYYYTLRKYALYDFITGKDIDVNVKEMVE